MTRDSAVKARTDRRLPRPYGSLLNRERPVTFVFEGERLQGFEGDTIASALAANGKYLLSRSFKYHRARGAVSFAGHDGNTLVQISGNPNAQADRERIVEGMVVEPVNVFGDLRRDRARWLDTLSRFLPVGFYYKAFFRPMGAWPLWSRWFRKLTGYGVLDPHYRPPRHDKRYRFYDAVVVGAGVAGLRAACTLAQAGVRVLLVEEHVKPGGAMWYEPRLLPDGGQTLQDLLEQVTRHAHIDVMTQATCNGWFADHWLAIVQGHTLHKVRTRQLILATGVIEQPAVFRYNDLPGIVLSSGVQRLIHLYGVKPGDRAVVLTGNDQGYAAALDLIEAGTKVVAVVELRKSAPSTERVRAVAAAGVTIYEHAMVTEAMANTAQTHVAAVRIERKDRSVDRNHSIHLEVDLVCVAVGFMPTFQLAAQAGATLHYDDKTARFELRDLPESVHLAGAVCGSFSYRNALQDGEQAAAAALSGLGVRVAPGTSGASPEGREREACTNVPWPVAVHPRGKEFVDLDEDLHIADLISATKEGYRDIQLVKRYSTCGMGPSQGRLSALGAARIVAKANGMSVSDTGVTTARPPFAAETLAHSAGRSYYPERRSSMHAAHVAAGATFMQAGLWSRPAYYGNEQERTVAIKREVQAVREGVGLIDVSTLGGLDVRGPDAGEFLNRLYTWEFDRQSIGRVRYALMTDESGVVIDDGVVGRLDDHHFYVTATTSGVDRVYRSMLKWNAQWGLDVDVTHVTSAYAAVNLAGPKSRQVLAALCDDVALGADAFGYMSIRTGHVAQIPARLLRVGFVGELGYEIHVPQSMGLALWRALMTAGAPFGITPFGVEAQRVMRLEKGHIIVGQDTDAMTHPLEIGMRWAISGKKPFFVGGRTLAALEARGVKRQLVGFRIDSDRTPVPLENQLVLDKDAIIGRVTSCCRSPSLGAVIGLAYVPTNYTRRTLTIKCRGGERVQADRVSVPFYDPDNERQRR